jgi:crotonobetainyl-CoA hydratase
MVCETILTDERGSVFIVTFNRPEKCNAVSSRLWAETVEALEYFEGNENLRALVITNEGRYFCAGSDIREIAAGTYGPPAGKEDWGICGLIHHVCKKPVILAVNGSALGAGVEMILAADIVVGSEDGLYGFPEVCRGLIANGGLLRAARQLPLKIALELLMTGDPISAQKARDFGLVNYVVPAGEVLQKALAIAERICENAPLAVQYSKAAVYRTLDMEIYYPSAAWDIVDYYTKLNYETEDKIEGTLAFAEKRKPVWKRK